jgi:hypothetical protein
MVNINLLPWREEEIKYQKKCIKKILAITILFALTINIVSHFVLAQQENALQQRIDASNEMLKKSEISNLPDMDNELRDITTFIGKIFSASGKEQQAKACFTEIKNDDQSFLIRGKARSMQDLLDWKAESFPADMKIKQIKQQESGIVQFDLEVKK